MGTKHDQLTDEEMASYSISPAILPSIEQFRASCGLEPSKLRIPDWGCGRGRTVGKPLEARYDAWGMDIDAKPIENGRGWFDRHGFDPQTRLLCVRPGDRLPFGADFFHIVVSDQVLEHVENIESCVGEMSRVTMADGLGVHTFPARSCVVEPHLRMPFVHWIPKGLLRDLAIAGFVRLGVERKPYWPDNDGDWRSRAKGYAKYSRNHTFYRLNGTLRRVFESRCFRAAIVPAGAACPLLVQGKPSLNSLAWKQLARRLFHWYRATCKEATLFARKV